MYTVEFLSTNQHGKGSSVVTYFNSLFRLLLAVLLWTHLATSASALPKGKGAVPIQGVVIDSETGMPIPRVTVRVAQTGISTMSNDEGLYRLLLPPGSYEMRFSHISHHSEVIFLEMTDAKVERDIELRSSVIEVPGMKVYTRSFDPAQRVIIEAIRRKKEILERIQDYRFDAYTRVVFNNETDRDSAEIFMIGESQTTVYWEQPDRYKEIVTARKQTANVKADNILIAVGEFLNFNEHRLEIGDYSLVSPTARDALDHYNYYLLDTIQLDEKLVYRLEMEPKNPAEPLFAGIIDIVDSSFDVVAVDLGFTEGVRFPFLSNMRYSQVSAQFDNRYWMPVEIRFGGDFELKVPLPGIPSQLSLMYVASLHSFEFDKEHEQGTFDEYSLEVVESVDDVDTTEWNARQSIPLTREEIRAYARIDSVENMPEPLGRSLAKMVLGAAVLVAGGARDIFHFNRVEGSYAGLGVQFKKPIPRTTFTLRTGYAFDGKYWQHDYGVEHLLGERHRLTVSGEYHDEIVHRPTIISADDYNPTLLALASQIDPLDYFLEKGFRLSASIRPINRVRLTMNLSDYNQYSTPVHSEYSLIGGDKQVRGNPEIAQGKYRALTFGFKYDSRPVIKYKSEEIRMSVSQYTLFDANVEYASPDVLGGDFDFRRYSISVFRKQRLLSLGVSSLFLYAGLSGGDLPPQRSFTVDYGTDFFLSAGQFGTLNERNFYGDQALVMCFNHDLDNLLFARSGLPLVGRIPFTASVHGGVFWTDFADSVAPHRDEYALVAPTAYGEIGFGLANLTPFWSPFNMAMYFTWQLSDYDTSKFRISLGIKF